MIRPAGTGEALRATAARLREVLAEVSRRVVELDSAIAEVDQVADPREAEFRTLTRALRNVSQVFNNVDPKVDDATGLLWKLGVAVTTLYDFELERTRNERRQATEAERENRERADQAAKARLELARLAKLAALCPEEAAALGLTSLVAGAKEAA